MKSVPIILLFLTPFSFVYSPLFDAVKIDPVTHRAIPFDRTPEFAFSAGLSLAIILISAWLITINIPRPVFLALALIANSLLLLINLATMIG